MNDLTAICLEINADYTESEARIALARWALNSAYREIADLAHLIQAVKALAEDR